MNVTLCCNFLVTPTPCRNIAAITHCSSHKNPLHKHTVSYDSFDLATFPFPFLLLTHGKTKVETHV